MSSFRRFFQRNIQKKTEGGSKIIEHPGWGEHRSNIGFSNAPREWAAIRQKHYEQWLGNASRGLVWHEVLPVIPHIDIHVFPPSEELGRHFYTLITSGMSDERMKLPKGIDPKYSRAEIVFYTSYVDCEPYQTEKPWYTKSISFFAHFPFDYDTWFAGSHTIPNGNPPAPVVEGSILTTALFLPPIFEVQGFTNGLKLGMDKVNFLWLTYISDKECEYKLEHGYDALVEKLNATNFPQVFDPNRKSVL